MVAARTRNSVDAQTFAHLPVGWSLLYHLAQLDRAAFEKLVQEGAIHPKLTLEQARALLATSRGRPDQFRSRKTNLKLRLKRFAEFVCATVNDWQPDDRELAKRELILLVERIKASDSAGFDLSIRGDGDHSLARIEPSSWTITGRSSVQPRNLE